MSKKTASGLVAYAVAQIGRPYWWGTFGQISDARLLSAKRQQYPDYYRNSDFNRQLGRKVHDCCGLIKGYRWSDGPDAAAHYNRSQDVSASGLYRQCSRRGPIAQMPDVPGTCVWRSDLGHVGVYIGNGDVVEARGHAYGVTRTKLSGGPWALWGQPDWIDYEGKQEAEPVPMPEHKPQPSRGPEYQISMQLLRRGSFSPQVRTLQRLLIAQGYDCGPRRDDGHFGADTEAATKKYQLANGLIADGRVGPATWDRLLRG